MAARWYAKRKPKEGTTKEAILDAIRVYGPQCTVDIARRLKWPMNSVSARVSELLSEGLIRREAGPFPCKYFIPSDNVTNFQS